jgi:glycosyltransferase involved in cell wall biosynthesis
MATSSANHKVAISSNELLTPEAGLVSVIIPCYNQAHFLHEAIQSALAQTYSHREIFIVDDGSTDNTAEVTAGFGGVRYIRQENLGVSTARNQGLKGSRGEYLVFLDADDRLLPEALEIGIDCMRQHPECAFASGHSRFITADGALLAPPAQLCVTRDHYLELLRGNYIWCPGSVIYRRSAFEVVKGFDTSLGPGADYDLYLRITRNYPVFCHNQFVAGYRLHSSSMSADPSLMLQDTLKALDAQWDFVKGSDSRVEALETGKKQCQSYYGCLQMADRIFEVVRDKLPPGATVAVATGGDKRFLRLAGRRAWHFPQTDAGERGRLFGQGAEGSADVPWIEAGMRYEFRLFGGPKYSNKLAAISVTDLADADPGLNVGSVPSGQAYLVAVPNPVPAPNRFGRTTITWSTGNGSSGRLYVSHGGEYNGDRPRNSDEVIDHLEAIRARGAQYLLFPATEFWWLDQYQKFREHLETRYSAIVRDKRTCIIFDLRESSK